MREQPGPRRRPKLERNYAQLRERVKGLPESATARCAFSRPLLNFASESLARSSTGFSILLDDRPDPFLSNRLDERTVIALILVGILDRELSDRVVKNSTRSHVARDHGRIA